VSHPAGRRVRSCSADSGWADLGSPTDGPGLGSADTTAGRHYGRVVRSSSPLSSRSTSDRSL
jgi:hypothetical protein